MGLVRIFYSLRNHMAQPAIPVFDDRTDLLGVPVFWHKSTADPPSSWDFWIGPFNLVITFRQKCDPRELLKPPAVVHDDPIPKPEAVGLDEDAVAIANRIAKNEAAVRRVEEMNDERRARVPRVAPGVYYYEVEQRIKSRLFFSLGSEGRKRFLHSYPVADLNAISFQEFHEFCVLLFKKEKNYIIERLQMYNAVHTDRESLEAFYWRFTGQAALCGWSIDQEKEVVRDIFILKMSFKDIQRELCIRPGVTPEETLKLLQEKGAQTASDLQKQFISSASMGSFSQSGSSSGQNTRVKQEPSFSVQGKKLSDRINRAQNNRSKGNANEKAKLCYFCGNRFSANHKQSCPARNVTCRNCSKKGHFAKCCNSKNVANVDVESDETVEKNCHFITSDSESEFAVLSVSAEESIKSIASVKKLEVVDAAMGKLRCIQITLRCGKTFFKATVDTGSPASFVNKRTADYIMKSVPAAKVFSEQECPIDTVYVDYNRKRIELLGTLIVNVSSLGWHKKSEKFLISQNRTRCLLGLDLQSQLGVRTTQVRPGRPLVGEVSQSNSNETSESLKLHFQQSFNGCFPESVEPKIIKFSLHSGHCSFRFKKKEDGYQCISKI